MRVYVCVCLWCVFVCVWMCVFVCVWMCVFVCARGCVCLCVCVWGEGEEIDGGGVYNSYM